ncbi:hypothetical protein KP509_33G056200 [Ceratopteris richardii]|uniref:CUE domain-containing protein n=1 Tax=Ceratopteris richardii TaxID=49495 RepID=A0A8T2QPW9_CERRI|nr:hypothetical protein KP509_33G056200 [Ceratopteris richardii]
MSAVVCGKRSLFEEIHPPVQKRLRCGGGTSPVRFSSLRSGSPLGYCEVGPSSSADPVDQVSQLRNLFPEMDGELIEKVLEASGNNLDSAIRSLNELRLSSDVGDETVNLSVQKNEALGHEGHQSAPLDAIDTDKTNQGRSEGNEWVELFVHEMLSAANLDDAKDRATRALEAFENAVIARSGCVFQELQKENAVLKEQIHNLIKENHILKRAVAIQHERNAEHENCPQEMQRLKQLVAQYQEQVRTLEVNNYALTLHLRKAQEGSSIPGRFHPDVF